MGSSSKELLHLVHKSSSTTSSNAVLYLRFRVFLPMCTVFLFFLPKLHFFIVCKRESQESHHQTEKPPTDGNYGHSQHYDIEVLAGNDSSVIEMDLMLVCSCEGVAAA
ncbi:hypothetical protein BDE02_09G072800 [Populus trichocarpa]|nr:hypothetical protein BDE02_09G072800 [Populus trichocarpa]